MANDEERKRVKKVYDDVAAVHHQQQRREKISEGVKKAFPERKRTQDGHKKQDGDKK